MQHQEYEERVDEVFECALSAAVLNEEEKDELRDRLEAACARGAVDAIITGASMMLNRLPDLYGPSSLAEKPGGTDGDIGDDSPSSAPVVLTAAARARLGL